MLQEAAVFWLNNVRRPSAATAVPPAQTLKRGPEDGAACAAKACLTFSHFVSLAAHPVWLWL